jgi:hypothetical protein
VATSAASRAATDRSKILISIIFLPMGGCKGPQKESILLGDVPIYAN